jgi:Domain of unknown function (DUF5054)
LILIGETVPPRTTKVHLIFKTHLDIGFTDLAGNVIANYFSHYIPRAIEVARTLREQGGAERFVWTTGSWLIYEYLEQGTPKQRALMEEAIAAGDIAWHGLPFTTHTELMEASLFKYGLSLSHELDRRFGRKTIAAKMTDVPGHTRGIVPLLADAGIEFLHIGVNAASTPPDVPSVFQWQDPSGAEVMVMYHKGSYGDLMVVPGMNEAIAFAHTGDNLGPQSPEQIIGIFADMRDQFPGATIAASTLDEFAKDLRKVRAKLPVVIQEIGDTWLHGVGTDPKKVAQFRELSRLRSEWLESGKVKADDQQFAAFGRFMLMIPEHTWGLDEKTHLADYANYDLERFSAARHQANFKKMEASWQEQRAYVTRAVEALGDSPLAAEATKRLKVIEPVYPDHSGFEEIADPSAAFETTRFSLRFDPVHGGLVSLVEKSTGRQWASANHVLGLICHEMFSQDDYNRFWRQYIQNKEVADIVFWAILDYTKPGIESPHTIAFPRLVKLYRRQDSAGEHFLLLLNAPEGAPYGRPKEFALSIDFSSDEATVTFDLQWFKKTACRLPEALWFSFKPKISDPKAWQMEKLGELISPLDAVKGGNRNLHAVNRLLYQDKTDRMTIENLDAPLVAPGKPSLLTFDNKQPPLKDGMHFNLYNNVWGTNFRMWYEDDARFRFVLKFERL